MTDTTEMFGRLHGQPMWQMSQSMPIRRRRGSWEAFRLLHIITQYLGAKRHLQITSVMWKELACFHHDSTTINFFFYLWITFLSNTFIFWHFGRVVATKHLISHHYSWWNKSKYEFFRMKKRKISPEQASTGTLSVTYQLWKSALPFQNLLLIH